jgi:hypothetical protein
MFALLPVPSVEGAKLLQKFLMTIPSEPPERGLLLENVLNPLLEDCALDNLGYKFGSRQVFFQLRKKVSKSQFSKLLPACLKIYPIAEVVESKRHLVEVIQKSLQTLTTRQKDLMWFLKL